MANDDRSQTRAVHAHKEPAMARFRLNIDTHAAHFHPALDKLPCAHDEGLALEEMHVSCGCLFVSFRVLACRRIAALLCVDCSSIGLLDQQPLPEPAHLLNCVQMWAPVRTTLAVAKSQHRAVSGRSLSNRDCSKSDFHC